jgi:hypothetical protein
MIALACAALLGGCRGSEADAAHVERAACTASADCEDGLVCSDGRCRNACATSAECGGSACVAGGCRDETCNFRDDDGNGEVDEGFDWVVDPWETLFETKYGPQYPFLLPLSTGNFALSISDSYGANDDRNVLALLSPAGELVAGPLSTPITAVGIDPASVAEGPDGEIGIVTSTTDYAACSACTAPLQRRRAADLSLLGMRDVALPFAPHNTKDMVWAGDAYVLSVREAATYRPHLVWTRDGSSVTRTVDLPPGDSAFATLLADGDRVVWLSGVEEGDVSIGAVHASDGSPAFPTVQLTATGRRGVNSPHNLLRVGDRLVGFWTERNETDQHVPYGVVLDEHGALVSSGKIAALARQAPAKSIEVDGNAVVLGAEENATNFIVRLRNDLVPVRTPSSHLEFGAGNTSVTIAAAGDHLLVIRGAGDDDPKHVRIARVHCR